MLLQFKMTENTKYISYLVEQARKGSKSAFYRLFEINLAVLYPIAIRLTANEETATKIIQETILFALRNISQARRDSTFSSWLKAITVRECINLHFSPASETHLGEGPDFIYNKDLLTEFDLAILRLPREPRYIIILYDFLKYSMTEISDMLSLGSPENVRVMIRLARKKILGDVML